MNEPTNHKSNTTSSGEGGVSFNMNVPRATSLSSAWLLAHGWVVFDKGTWKKGKDLIKFDGVNFRLNNERNIQFTNELPKEEK